VEKPVVFWGAGNYAMTIFDGLYEEYKPVCFGDSARHKHGTVFLGLPVYSFEQIEQRYPGCLFFVACNETVKYDVINSLAERGVTAERVINFEKEKKYKSCPWLESYLLLSPAGLCYCCGGFGKNKPPQVARSGDFDADMQSFLNTRDSIIVGLNTGLDADAANPCIGCPEVKEGLWAANRRIRQINFNYRAFCNFNCIYCTADANTEKRGVFSEEATDALEFFRRLELSGVVDKNTVVEMASGEITLNPLRERILSAIRDYPCWIYSNASGYEEQISEILAFGRSKLIVSIDCGTRETFTKIKGVDFFEKVVRNIREYSSHGLVELKYIVLPGINDNDADINGVIELCKSAKIKLFDISRNLHDMSALNERSLDAIVCLCGKLQALSINVSIPEWLFTGTGDYRRVQEKIAEYTGVGVFCV
jgi:sulfatase maturation enzyme AslB (radical SAM superfamily)